MPWAAIVVHVFGHMDQVQWIQHPDWSRRKADGSLVGGEGWNPHAMGRADTHIITVLSTT